MSDSRESPVLSPYVEKSSEFRETMAVACPKKWVPGRPTLNKAGGDLPGWLLEARTKESPVTNWFLKQKTGWVFFL